MKHTPGPWNVEEVRSERKDMHRYQAWFFCNSYDNDKFYIGEFNLRLPSDAHLIANAPEMEQILIKILRYLWEVEEQAAGLQNEIVALLDRIHEEDEQ